MVSVCIPTYNAGDYFEDCLRSALDQTYRNLEILISDDGSTDHTMALIKKYQQDHANIRLVQNPNPGMVNNWNHCIEQASGEWIKFLFQDDLLKPDCVEKMLAACIAHDAEVGLCRRKFIIHDDVAKHIRYNVKYKLVLPERIFEDMVYISPERLAAEMAEVLPENALGEPTCYFFHKKIVKRAGMFNPDYKHVVDLEFILRLGLVNGLVFLSEPLAFFRVHGKSETSANMKEEKESIIRNIAALEGDNILLFFHFLHEPSFALMKERMGEDVLQLRLNHLYYSGCKHRGKRIFNKALEPIRSKYKELGEMRYHFFKYVYYRKQYRNWLKQNRM